MKKPRILKMDYFDSIICVDLEEVQSVSFVDMCLAISFRNTDLIKINVHDNDDDEAFDLQKLALNTYTAWKNYDEEREQQGLVLMNG